ncbi:MAG: SsrA-binding protein SmpB [Candidatus Moranbacteria bacterium]|nr:SsrA-binding protein SmpB [Candidatus Moranbacteria bacterium]
MATLAVNKRAHFDYEISDKFEAGLVLTGQEVKSAKTGHISLKGSFVTVHGNELYLTNANIPPYRHAGDVKNYDPTRSRKLLLKRTEIKSLIGKARVSGLTLVPIRVYTKKRLVKLEFGVGRGKKEFDKREKIAKREVKRRMERELKNF